MLLTYQFELKVEEKLSVILGHLSYAASKLFNVGNYERKEYKTLGFDSIPNWYDQKKRLKVIYGISLFLAKPVKMFLLDSMNLGRAI